LALARGWKSVSAGRRSHSVSSSVLIFLEDSVPEQLTLACEPPAGYPAILTAVWVLR
jgi:hypothetical protein